MLPEAGILVAKGLVARSLVAKALSYSALKLSYIGCSAIQELRYTGTRFSYTGILSYTIACEKESTVLYILPWMEGVGIKINNIFSTLMICQLTPFPDA